MFSRTRPHTPSQPRVPLKKAERKKAPAVQGPDFPVWLEKTKK
jgi:hypothetical protein